MHWSFPNLNSGLVKWAEHLLNMFHAGDLFRVGIYSLMGKNCNNKEMVKISWN